MILNIKPGRGRGPRGGTAWSGGGEGGASNFNSHGVNFRNINFETPVFVLPEPRNQKKSLHNLKVVVQSGLDGFVMFTYLCLSTL